jgi:hypothetical protein
VVYHGQSQDSHAAMSKSCHGMHGLCACHTQTLAIRYHDTLLLPMTISSLCASILHVFPGFGMWCFCNQVGDHAVIAKDCFTEQRSTIFGALLRMLCDEPCILHYNKMQCKVGQSDGIHRQMLNESHCNTSSRVKRNQGIDL